VLMYRCEARGAASHAGAAMVAARGAGDPTPSGEALYLLAWLSAHAGDLSHADATAAEAIELAVRRGDVGQVADRDFLRARSLSPDATSTRQTHAFGRPCSATGRSGAWGGSTRAWKRRRGQP
jgi:hypothetical protein